MTLHLVLCHPCTVSIFPRISELPFGSANHNHNHPQTSNSDMTGHHTPSQPICSPSSSLMHY